MLSGTREAARYLGVSRDQSARAIRSPPIPEAKAAERATFTARRKEAYEALHPEAAYASRPGRAGKSRQDGDNSDAADRFTADTAAKTGQSERSVQRDAERGAKVTPEALAA